jgi:hypothetical protein
MKIQHLNESIKSLTSDELQSLLETDYSEAYEHAKDGHYIFKGMYMTLDPSMAHLLEPLKDRKSKNTFNYYTLWMNNSQEWSEYPKRSVICTNSSREANGYGFQTFIILPKNGTKIGVCDDSDLWSSFDFGGGMVDASDVNYFFNAMFEKFYKKTPETYEDMVGMLKGIEVNDETLNYVSSAMSSQGLSKSKLLNIFKEHGAYGLFASLFSTKGFEMTTVGGVHQYNDKPREVWFDNQFIAIDIESKSDIIR